MFSENKQERSKQEYEKEEKTQELVFLFNAVIFIKVKVILCLEYDECSYVLGMFTVHIDNVTIVKNANQDKALGATKCDYTP